MPRRRVNTNQRKPDAYDSGLIDWLQGHWNLVLIGIVVLLGAVFLGARTVERSTKASKDREKATMAAAKAEERKAEELRKVELRKRFAIEPLPPTPKLGTPPKPPPIPPVEISPNGQRAIGERVRFLIEKNPIAEIHDDMSELVGNGSLALDLNVQNGLAGAFAYVPAAMIRTAEGAVPPGTEAAPVFSMDPAVVDRITTPTDALRAMLVVYHEFQHYQQWNAATANERLHFLPKLVGSVNTPAQCVHVWESEVDAYEKECAQALAWGITDSAGDLCLRSEDPIDFRRTLFIMMGLGPQGQNSSECLSTWARLAGHPHPEAYD